MFTASAELYDLIYRSFKDYAAEAEQIAGLLRERQPTCRSILDVACGTGEHVRLLNARGFLVDGLDLDLKLLEVARGKSPQSRFYHADMCAFGLNRRYDAVLCLFSSIGYAASLPRVTAALSCFRQHIVQDGLVVVEPWFQPGAMDPARTDSRTVESGSLRVTRASRVEIVDRVSRVTFEYEVSRGAEIARASEVHDLGLFTRNEMEAAFAAAGLRATYDPVGLSGRGLYLARVNGGEDG